MSETNVKPSERIEELILEGGHNPDSDISKMYALIAYLDEQHERAVKHVEQVDSKECEHEYIAVSDNPMSQEAEAVCRKCGNPPNTNKNVENVSGDVSEVEELAHELYKIRHPASLVWKLETNKKKLFYSMARYVIEKYSKRPAKDVKQDLSKCCKSPVKAVGGVTMHYECVKCGNVCDIGGFDSKELVELDEEELRKLGMAISNSFTERKQLPVAMSLFIEQIVSRFGVPKKLSVEEIEEIINESNLYYKAVDDGTLTNETLNNFTNAFTEARRVSMRDRIRNILKDIAIADMTEAERQIWEIVK